MILVDSTVVIDLLRGWGPARTWVEQQGEVLAASEITRVEVRQGIRSSERHVTQRALDGYRWMPVDATVATRAGDLGRQFRASHALDVADLVVAATAEVHGLRLATSNVKHFPMLSTLAAPY